MRVAVIISRIDHLGPVKVIQNLVNSLSAFSDLRMNIFYFDEKVNETIIMKVPVARLNRSEFRFDDFDIIHTSGIRPDLFAYLHRKKIRYHISTIHNYVFEDLASTYNNLTSWIFGNIWLTLWKHSNKLVCVSHSLKTYYSRWFTDEKLAVIHNGITDNTETISESDDVICSIREFRSQGLKVLGFAGILTTRKGADQILTLLPLRKEIAFVILGDGKEMETLTRQAAKLDVSDRCLFCGFKENAVNYFKYFDFFVMPSRSEGFGLALIEAVQQNIPVICTDIDVFKELFTDEEVTFFKSEDLSSLSNAITSVIESGKLKSKMAYARYMNNYKSDLMAQRYHELYKSALL